MNIASEAEIWERIAGLKPRLRGHVQWYCHHYRGVAWWLLQDPASGQHYKLSDSAHRFLQRLDGESTLDQVFEALSTNADTPHKEEILTLMTRLQMADLLQFAGPFDPATLFQRWQQQRNKSRRNAWLRPLAVRLPLMDPSRLLDSLMPWVHPLFRRLSFIVWCGFILLAVLLGPQYQTELVMHGSSRFLDPINLLLLWLLYPLVKGLHELGHALVIRNWGGTVRELGIMFLVFVPLPYVDGSAATAFQDKHRRMLVGAAGIMVELLLAAMAMFLWLTVQPGLLRDLAFNVMVIGGVSTLLFNGNPLLRFDGYYVLADSIEIPNLATRSQQYYRYLGKRYLLGMSEIASPVIARGERAWFLFYGAASICYRIFISLVIALYVAGKFFVFGLLLALYVVITQLLLPLLRVLHYLIRDRVLKGRRTRAVTVGFSTITALLVILLIVPVPANTVAEGILLTPKESIIRAAGSGEVAAVLKTPGELLKKGEVLVRLVDTELDMQQRVLEARAHELQARLERASLQDQVKAGILREQLEELAEKQQDLQRKLDNLIVTNPSAGIADLQMAADLPGRFVSQGEILGVMRRQSKATARVVVPQEEANRVREQTHGIDVRVMGTNTRALPVNAMRAVPAGTYRLPSIILGTQGGGDIAVDASDEQGLTTIEPVFHFDLELPADNITYFPGARVQVRFRHSPEALGPRWYRSVRRLLLARLNI